MTWNGSNHQSVIVEADWDLRYSVITDEEEIAKYVAILEKAEDEEFRAAGTGYHTAEVELDEETYNVTQSQWQGDWELYTITETEQ